MDLVDLIELAEKKNKFKILSNDIITKALKNIYSKKVNVKSEIEKNLFDATLSSLSDAIMSVEFGNVNQEFIGQLKSSVEVFAAFKTHRQQNDIAQQMLDEKGKLKAFEKFAEDTKQITGKYNKLWLRTEFDTAVIRARAAANFKKFAEDTDLFPNLKWLPSTSPHPRDAHRAFYNLVRPYNDDFWKSHYPGNEWNCKCSITNTDDPEDRVVPKVNYVPSPGIDENPGFTGNIFTKTHPYVEEQYTGAEKAVNSFLKNK